MGISFSVNNKKVSYLNDKYDFILKYNDKEDKILVSNINLHQTDIFCSMSIPYSIQHQNSDYKHTQFELDISDKVNLKSIKINLYLEKRTDNKYINQKEKLYESKIYKEGNEVIFRYDEDYKIKYIIIKFFNLLLDESSN